MFGSHVINLRIVQDSCTSVIVYGLILVDKYKFSVDLDGFGVTCSPPDPRLAGSNSAEVDGFFKPEKIGLRAKFYRRFHVLVIP